MFYDPGSRDRPGSRGIVSAQRGYIGSYDVLSNATKNYLTAGAGVSPPPIGRLVACGYNEPPNSNIGVVTGVAENSNANPLGVGFRGAGIYGLGVGSPPAGINVGNIRGGDFDGIFVGPGSADTVVGTIHYAESRGGTVTNMAAIRTIGPFANGAVPTNNYGIWIGQLLSSSSTTQVGLKIEAIGAANGKAIVTGNDPVQFPGLTLSNQIVVSPNAASTSITSIDTATSAIQCLTGAGVWSISHIVGNAGANGPLFCGAHTRGTVQPLTQVICVAGDSVGGFAGYGSDGVTFQEVATINFKVDTTPAANTVPGRIEFEVVLGSQQFLSTIATMDSAGRFGIGVTPAHFLDIKAGTSSIAQMRLASSTVLTTAAAGAIEFDGKALYQTSVGSARQIVNAEQIQALSGSRTFTSNTSPQAIFNASANGAVTLAASTSYHFELSIAATGFSSSAHTLNFGFGGTATFTSIGYYYNAQTGSTVATPTADFSGWIATATATAICASTSTTGLQFYARGIMRISAGGTVIPQLTQITNSAAAVVQPNSFFRCWPVGSDTVTNVGNWS